MANKLDELIAKQNTEKPYTALTQQQIEKQASDRYQSTYDQKRLSAQQAYDTSDQALRQQLEGLQQNYDKQRSISRLWVSRMAASSCCRRGWNRLARSSVS